MLGKSELADKDLLKTVNQRLVRMGSGSESRLSASVQRGAVTLRGTLHYENQRVPIVRAISNVAGVHHVVDQLQVAPKTVY